MVDIPCKVKCVKHVLLNFVKISSTSGNEISSSGVPKIQSFDKAEPNSQLRGKYIRNNLIRIQVSPIYKLSGTPD
jgi:hypothetical protein